MRSVVVTLLIAAPLVAEAKPWKPHPIHVIPGVPLKRRGHQAVRAAEPAAGVRRPSRSDVKVVEVDGARGGHRDPAVVVADGGQRDQGRAAAGEGHREGPRAAAPSHVWYALEPFGWICGHEARPTTEPATTEQVLKVREGSRLPFQYVMVLVKDEEKLPMWTTLDDLKNGAEPERLLKKGDTVAIEKSVRLGRARSIGSASTARSCPAAHTAMMGGGAEWHGIELDDKTPLPFGWVTPDKANVYAAPPEAARRGRRTRRSSGARAWQHRRRAHGRQEEVAEDHRRRAAAAADLRQHHGRQRRRRSRRRTPRRRTAAPRRLRRPKIRLRKWRKSGYRPTR